MYRPLTTDEISVLTHNGCSADDWANVQVADGFAPRYLHRVDFYGEVRLGAFTEDVELTQDFRKHAGIYDATLRNVTVGDNCLIEHIGSYINAYSIGNHCVISNVAVMETTQGTTFGEGNTISVLNEAGEGNVILFHGLSAQMAALMVKHFKDDDFRQAFRRLVNEEIERTLPDHGSIGNNVKIVNTREITNTLIQGDCEISGAARISDCTILSSENSSVYIGTDSICENSIIVRGASITDGAKVQDCFVGEACQLQNGFTASQSLFFANSVMACGEACAAFCGPFSASHHKSTLLIGTQMSFYNAGSATNYSNHAYKMGPIHYGTLCRGTKTASGAHLLLPARIGSFSMVMGKVQNHPDTTSFPFSYLIADGGDTWLVPGRNLTTAGLYRDVRKWQQRDMRPADGKKSIVNFEWLSPYTVEQIVRGKQLLERLIATSGNDTPVFVYHGMKIKQSSLKKGLRFYDMALHMYMAEGIDQLEDTTDEDAPKQWDDLSGMLIPEEEERQLVAAVKEGSMDTIQDVENAFVDIQSKYPYYASAARLKQIYHNYNVEELTEELIAKIKREGLDARRQWLQEIRKDAEREFALGDVSRKTLDAFIAKLSAEQQLQY